MCFILWVTADVPVGTRSFVFSYSRPLKIVFHCKEISNCDQDLLRRGGGGVKECVYGPKLDNIFP
jgi:hypothetical protein